MILDVKIRRVETRDGFVDYSYGDDDAGHGLVRLDVRTGDFEILERAPGDRDDTRLAGALHVLRLHWEKGEVPDETSYVA